MNRRLAFLVSHGTDTMSWALAYLTYSLKDCPAPVALVGSQLPMTERFSGSDGFNNITLAVNTLVELGEARCFVAFDHGRRLFTRNLWKKDKWDADAFVGTLAGVSNSNQFIYMQGLRRSRRPIDVLYVIRAGGTIDAEVNSDDYLGHGRGQEETPSVVFQFVDSEFRENKHLAALTRYVPVFNGDSSDCTEVQWAAMSEGIAKCCRAHEYMTTADHAFCRDVRVVSCTPFTTTDEYRRAFEGARAVVLVGYGAGNTNIRRESSRSPLGPLQDFVDVGGTAVLCSQATHGVIDSVYENGGLVFDNRLALPGLDYSIASAQVKLGFILGHESDLGAGARELARTCGISQEEARRKLVALLFLSGGAFTNVDSRERLLRPWGMDVPREDLLVNSRFELALEKAVHLASAKPVRRHFIPSGAQVSSEGPSLLAGTAAIVKPDRIVGANAIGESLDAASGIRVLLEQAFEWTAATVELADVSASVTPETLAGILARTHVTFWEGGRPSVFDATSFSTPSRDYVLELVGRAVAERASNHNAPGNIFICLSHQLAWQYLYEAVCGSEDRFLLTDGAVGSAARGALRAFLRERDTLRAKLDLGPQIVARGEVESGLSKLTGFAHPTGIPDVLAEAHDSIAQSFSGLVEDLLPHEPLDIGMAHGDHVDATGALFVNWALMSLSRLRHQHAELAASASLSRLPIGAEVTSSSCAPDGSLRCAVASSAIYYRDGAGFMCQDLTFQFHPELLGTECLSSPLSGEDLQLSFKNDGLRLLLGAVTRVMACSRCDIR